MLFRVFYDLFESDESAGDELLSVLDADEDVLASDVVRASGHVRPRNHRKRFA